MNWRLAVGLLGVAATLFGVGSLLGLWAGQQGSGDLGADPMAFVWLAAVVAAVAVLLVRANAGETGQSPESTAASRFADEGTPASTATGETRVAAEQFDADLREAVRRGGAQLEATRSLLRSTAVSAHAEAAGVSGARAERAIERGEWTDDGVAARFLADEAGLSRVRLFVTPVRERRRRIERTIGAIERLQEER